MRRISANNRGKNAGSAKPSKLERADNRLRQFVMLALALRAGAPSAALAADFPAPTPPPVYKELPVVYDWTGFYIGGNIGAAWQGLSGTNFSDTLGSTFTAPTNVQFMGGGQASANYQFLNGLVVGAEAMFDWLPASGNTPVTATNPAGTVAANINATDQRWLTTATARLGYAWDRILLYGKGGAAWVAGASPSISVAGAAGSFSSVSNTTATTWTAGLGLEWAFSGNWLLRAEYDYIALPAQTLTVSPATPTFGGGVITFSNRNLSLFIVAIDYKFGSW